MLDVLFVNCNIATCATSTTTKFGLLESTTNCIGLAKGLIAYVGPRTSIPELADECQTHDLEGRFVTPGLIDCHTHVVYGGNRCGEWELKLKGATYEEVAQAGGGIVNTVEGTRSASVEELVALARPRVEAMLREGTTCLEIKSGYGLDLNTERNMLLAGRRIGEIYPVDVVLTFLGAHAVPKEYQNNADGYIDTVLSTLDTLASEGLVDCVDAFCETVGFSVAQTQRVFDQATALNLPVRLHGDQLHDFGGASLAAKYNALSCDHCEHTSLEGVQVRQEGRGRRSTTVVASTAMGFPDNFFLATCLCPLFSQGDGRRGHGGRVVARRDVFHQGTSQTPGGTVSGTPRADGVGDKLQPR